MKYLGKFGRRAASLVALGVALAFLASCSSSGGGSQASGDGTVVMGLIVDLSGPTADLGKGDKLAAGLAVDAINAKGGINGRKLRLKVYDDQGDPSKTTNAATRLAYNDKAAAIICSYSSAAAAAAAAIAGQARIPMVTSAQVDSLTDKSQPWSGWVFRSTPGSSATVSFLAGFVEQKGYKRVAISHSSLDYGTSAASAVKKSLQGAGVTVDGDASLPPTISDASKEAARLVASHPDAVVSFDYPSPTAQIIKALRNLGYDGPIIANQSGMNQSVFAIAGAAAKNIYAVDSYDSSSPSAKSFNAAYQKATGVVPWNYQEAYEYANVQVVAQALKNAKSLSGEDVRAGFHKIDCLKTAVGRAGSCISYSDGDDDQEGSGAESQLMKYLASGTRGSDWKTDAYQYKQ